MIGLGTTVVPTLASAPSSPSNGQLYYNTATGLVGAYLNGAWVYYGPQNISTNQFRLTLSSGTPVPTSDLTAQSTLYLTPYIGNQISIYDGTAWQTRSTAEISVVLSGLTSGKNYDVIAYYQSGTVKLDLMPAWTNDTTRANAISQLNGVYSNTSSVTTVINAYSVAANQGRYVGTIRTTAATTTEDSITKRYVWNAQNRVLRPVCVVESTNSWTYSTAAWRQANGASGNKVEFVLGLAGDEVRAKTSCMSLNASSNATAVGIGLDSTTTNSAKLFGGAGSSSFAPTVFAEYTATPSIGYHYLAWLEYGGAGGTTTWYGTGGLSYLQAGLVGDLQA